MNTIVVIVTNGNGKQPERTEVSEDTWNFLLDLLRVTEWVTTGA